MANEEHVSRLKQGVDAWNTYYADNSGVSVDLIDADLSRVDLIGANLSDAILIGANLSASDLMGADLCGSELVGASLTQAT